MAGLQPKTLKVLSRTRTIIQTDDVILLWPEESSGAMPGPDVQVESGPRADEVRATLAHMATTPRR
jgi:hypothetical protein